jgi:hypothetical protein
VVRYDKRCANEELRYPEPPAGVRPLIAQRRRPSGHQDGGIMSVRHADKVEEMYPPSLDGGLATWEGGRSQRHHSARLF